MKNLKDEYPYLTIGLSMAVGMLFYSWTGYFIGNKLGNVTAGFLIGAFCGLLYCGYEFWKLIRQINKREDQG